LQNTHLTPTAEARLFIVIIDYYSRLVDAIIFYMKKYSIFHIMRTHTEVISIRRTQNSSKVNEKLKTYLVVNE